MIQNKRLKIFDDNVVIDNTLPKYKIKDNTTALNSISGGLTFANTFDNSGNFSWQTSTGTGDNFNRIVIGNRIVKPKTSVREYLIKLLSKKGKKKDISVTQLNTFFNNLKSAVSKIENENVQEVLDNYEFILSSAEATGQVALTQKLKSYSSILKQELVLSLSPFTSFLSEEDVINFYNVASKHDKYETKLKLTYIKNFVKVIPSDIIALKLKADDLLVFDNYAILHYDYLDNSVEETKEEIAKRKDPILFGLISGSTKLYYIGDWMSDYCDLTLDQIIVKLGKENVKLNSETINSSIEQI